MDKYFADKLNTALEGYQPLMDDEAFFPVWVDESGKVHNHVKTTKTKIGINSLNGEFKYHRIIVTRKLPKAVTNWFKSSIETRTMWKYEAEKALTEPKGTHRRTDYKVIVSIRYTEGGIITIEIENKAKLISQSVGVALIKEINEIIEYFIESFSVPQDVSFIRHMSFTKSSQE